ncbi:MAG: glycosyltransferase [bacterium]
MKIGLLTNVFFPVTNGVVHSIHLLAKGFRELNGQVDVLSSKHPKFSYEIIEKYGINYNLIKIPSIYFPKFDYCIPNPLLTKKELKKISPKFDIIQINHPFVIFKISKFLKKLNPFSKIVFVYHTQYEQYHHYVRFIPKNIYQRFLDSHIKEVFEFVDMVIFPSESIKRSLEEKFKKYSNKFHFISNPVDLNHLKNYNESFVKDLRKKYGLENNFVMGFVGRIEKEKNLYSLLQLFKETLEFFKNNHKDNIKLIIVGDGTQLNGLMKFSQDLNIKDYVIFTGKVNYTEISNYYALMDVFVTLSLTEVKPLAYLESLAMGVPILALNTPGADDLIVNEYNGFLVSYTDNYKQKFIEYIHSLYENRELLERVKENSISSVKEYNYLEVAKKYLKIYENL